MSLARVHTWAAAETLTASDLNAEFNNILNYLNGSGVTLTSPTITGGTLAGVTLTGTTTVPSGSIKTGGYVFNTNGAALSANSPTLANNGTLDLDTGNVSSFAGLLVVSNTGVADAQIRTNTVYAVQGRLTTFTSATLLTGNGTTSANTFTVTMPSGGVFRITNTGGVSSYVAVSFFGNALAG